MDSDRRHHVETHRTGHREFQHGAWIQVDETAGNARHRPGVAGRTGSGRTRGGADQGLINGGGHGRALHRTRPQVEDLDVDLHRLTGCNGIPIRRYLDDQIGLRAVRRIPRVEIAQRRTAGDVAATVAARCQGHLGPVALQAGGTGGEGGGSLHTGDDLGTREVQNRLQGKRVRATRYRPVEPRDHDARFVSQRLGGTRTHRGIQIHDLAAGGAAVEVVVEHENTGAHGRSRVRHGRKRAIFGEIAAAVPIQRVCKRQVAVGGDHHRGDDAIEELERRWKRQHRSPVVRGRV
jgi:hypothetical protein